MCIEGKETVHDNILVHGAADIQEISAYIEDYDGGAVTEKYARTMDGLKLLDAFKTGNGHPRIR